MSEEKTRAILFSELSNSTDAASNSRCSPGDANREGNGFIETRDELTALTSTLKGKCERIDVFERVGFPHFLGARDEAAFQALRMLYEDL